MGYAPQWDHVRWQFEAIAEGVKAQFPAAWQSSGHSTEYVERVVDSCRKLLAAPTTHAGVTKPLGQFLFCNGKRGNRHDISRDIVAFPNASGAASPDGGGVELHDFIVAHDSPQAHIGWGDVTQDTINGAAAAGIATPAVLVVPRSFSDSGTGGGTVDPCAGCKSELAALKASSVPKVGYPGDQVWDAFGEAIIADYRRANRVVTDAHGNQHVIMDARSYAWCGRTIHDDYMEGLTLEQSIAKHRAEWCALLGIPVI